MVSFWGIVFKRLLFATDKCHGSMLKLVPRQSQFPRESDIKSSYWFNHDRMVEKD